MGGVNHSIDESLKPWTKKFTQEDYEVRVGVRCDVCRRLFEGEGCTCPKNELQTS